RLGVYGCLVACILFIIAVRAVTYQEPVRGDQAVYAVIGHELLKGRSLYADLWDHKPPAIHASFALAELVTGFGPQQLFVLHIALSTSTFIGLFRDGNLLGERRAGLCAAVAWAIGSIFPHWEGYQPNTEVFLNALLVWSFCFTCRFIADPRDWLAWAV